MWNLMQYKNSICLQDEYGMCLSYGQVDEFSNKLGQIIGYRCLIFVLCTNTIGSVAGYTAFINYGIVPLLLNARVDKELFLNLFNLYRPDYLWIPSQQVDQRFGKVVFEEYQYCLIKTNYNIQYMLNKNLGLLLTTSGSTGSPKFVRQSYDNICVNADQIVEYLQLQPTERPITTLPMNYTYGLSIINSHLRVGATILLTDKGIMQRDFWDFFKEAKATSFGGVPYTYEMLDKLRFMRMELPSLRYMTQAGGKLSPELHKKFAEYAREKEKKFIVMYGQCEATARMAYLPAEDSLRKNGSIGIPIPQGSFLLIDTDGNEIQEAEVTGELVYKGPNVTMGYAEKPEDFALGDERKGYLETGDMAKRDAEGYYYIAGRKKRFLKVYGNRVNLDELDALLKKQYGNIECVSAGIDDHIYIFISNEAEEDLRERYAGEKIGELLRKYVSDKTSLNAIAFKIVVIPEIPKNDAGKIQYRELEKYYGI